MKKQQQPKQQQPKQQPKERQLKQQQQQQQQEHQKQQHRHHGHQMVISSTIIKIGLLIGSIFFINLFLLGIYLPSPSTEVLLTTPKSILSSLQQQQQQTNLNATKQQIQQQQKRILQQPNSIVNSTITTSDHSNNNNNNNNTIIQLGCFDYGCHIYPYELTSTLNDELSNVFITKKKPLLSTSFTIQQQQHQFTSSSSDTNNNNNDNKEQQEEKDNNNKEQHEQQQEQYNNNNNNNNNQFITINENMTLLTQIGASHKCNQDRGIVISPYRTKVTTTSNNEESFLIGIFDGHGIEGHQVAEYCTNQLPKRLAKKLNSIQTKTTIDNNNNTNLLQLSFDEQIKSILNETFIELDQYVPPNALFGGTTASITLRIGSKLYIANAGDSRTILVTTTELSPPQQQQQQQRKNNKRNFFNNQLPNYINVSIPYMTVTHTPDNPIEEQRILKLGGKIGLKGTLKYVNAYNKFSKEMISLAMSRSIGDWDWKKIGVIAEPQIDIIDLNNYNIILSNNNNNNNKHNNNKQQQQQAFLIAGSDGIWGYRRKEFYANQFAQSFHHHHHEQQQQQSKNNNNNHNDNNYYMHPLHKSWEIFQKIRPKTLKGYVDDATVIVMKL